MHILWHLEFHVDYSHFPTLGLHNRSDIAPSLFLSIGEQCRGYEQWRRRQKRVYQLHVYQSHFADFAKYPHTLPPDFFDFQVNILQRRHQAFVEHRQDDEPVILFSPGLMLEDSFDIEPLISKAMNENTMVCAVPDGGTGMLLSGVWVIPPSVQKEFCRPIPDQAALEYGGDDISYWLGLAKRVAEPVVTESTFLQNLLPQYAMSALPLPVLSHSGDPQSKHSFPTWTEEQFLEWMAKQSFCFASSMRWCPHEYVVMRDLPTVEEQMNYLMAIDYLHRHAVIDTWRGQFKFAAFVNGYKYWYCTVIDLLNRTCKELERRIFAEDGKDEYGRKIKR